MKGFRSTQRQRDFCVISHLDLSGALDAFDMCKIDDVGRMRTDKIASREGFRKGIQCSSAAMVRTRRTVNGVVIFVRLKIKNVLEAQNERSVNGFQRDRFRLRGTLFNCSAEAYPPVVDPSRKYSKEITSAKFGKSLPKIHTESVTERPPACSAIRFIIGVIIPVTKETLRNTIYFSYA